MNKDMLFYNNYIIKDDFKIYKDPKIDIDNTYSYNIDSSSTLFRYGNIIDSLLQTLTPYEVEKVRILALFLKGQNIQNISGAEVADIIRIATDPQYDDTIRRISMRLDKTNKNTPQPQNVPQTPLIQPIYNPRNVTTPPVTRPTTTTQNVDIKIEKDIVKRANPIVEKFLSDIRKNAGSKSFRGWMLPNGELLSQYVDTTVGLGVRQDHARLFKVFFTGLEKYNKDAYDSMRRLYDDYLKKHGFSSGDWDESFAVEVLGWMQIAHNGSMRILYRGERWQDRLLRPFLVDYGFRYEISDFGDCHYIEYMDIYNHIDEIISLGLEQKYGRLSA